MFSRAKSFWLFLLHATPILGATSFRGLSTSLEQYRCVAHCLLFSAENGKNLFAVSLKAVVLDSTIKKKGRWKSDAFLLYIRNYVDQFGGDTSNLIATTTADFRTIIFDN